MRSGNWDGLVGGSGVGFWGRGEERARGMGVGRKGMCRRIRHMVGLSSTLRPGTVRHVRETVA